MYNFSKTLRYIKLLVGIIGMVVGSLFLLLSLYSYSGGRGDFAFVGVVLVFAGIIFLLGLLFFWAGTLSVNNSQQNNNSVPVKSGKVFLQVTFNIIIGLLVIFSLFIFLSVMTH